MDNNYGAGGGSFDGNLNEANGFDDDMNFEMY